MGFKLPAGVAIGSTVLLETPGLDRPADEACLGLLEGEDSGRRSVVAVTVEDSPAEFIDAWLDRVSPDRADLTVLDVGSGIRSVAGQRSTAVSSRNVVQSIEDPADLPSIRACLEELLTATAASGRSSVVYVDDVGGLLEAAGLRSTIGFIDRLRELVGQTGSIAFVRLDQSGQRDHVVNVLARGFDAALVLAGEDAKIAWELRSGHLGEAADVDDNGSLPLDDQLELLSDRCRRLALHHLNQADGPMATVDLAARIANVSASEDTTEDRALERAYTGLVHVHLPLLESHGLVAMDDDAAAVRLRRATSVLEPLLTVTARGDLHG